MEENNKHQLEGLLQARSADLSDGRRSRTRRPVPTPPAVGARSTPKFAPPAARPVVTTSAARMCEDCGEAIGPRRLRAMPRAVRCLACQRSAEAPQTPA
ncbi:MAG TPA: TraR/DksA C4-type zinc finger protein [Thermoleophilaceae bacterium]|nr:TraR/DksA C4-type zinc finger protein [Thermoleophilaceae bacterium]